MNLKKILVIVILLGFMLTIMTNFVKTEEYDDSLNTTGEYLRLKEELIFAEKEIPLFEELGIPHKRYSDLLKSTEQLLNAQRALELTKGRYDYDVIHDRIFQLKILKDISLNVNDEFIALNIALESFGESEDELLNRYIESVNNEFKTERFEIALEEIDKVYVRMSELEAFDTKIKVAYSTMSRNIFSRIYNIRYYLFTSLILLTIIFIFGRKQYLRFKIKKQILGLEFRKEVIQGLIKTAQKGYFEDRTLNEATYHIRTKKYAELIRDINRELPLFKEKLALLSKKKTKGDNIEND